MIKYSFEQMKENYGVGFHSSVIGISEVFIGFQHYGDKIHSTEEEAREAVRDIWKNQYEQRVKEYQARIDKYEALPFHKKLISFIFKNGWKKNKIIKEVFDSILYDLEDRLRRTDEMEVKYLNRGEYYLDGHEFNVGDTFYVSVCTRNHLNFGVHKGEIKSVDYRLQNGNMITYTADTVVFDSVEKQEMGIRLELINNGVHSPGKISTGWTYHEVHLERDEAFARIRNYLKEQEDKLLEQNKILNQSRKFNK